MAALASLTEMYTDSEGEEGASFEDDPPITLKNPPPVAVAPVEAPKPVVEEPKPSPKPTPPPLRPEIEDSPLTEDSQLVSYLSLNDTVISDDEIDRPIISPDKPSMVELPPEPLGKCSAELQQKIAALTDKMKETGNDMNQIIQLRKSFRNPSIYEKLIQFCGINEFGTNYQPQIYDPLKWNKNSYYDELAKVQKSDMERRERERREKTKVEFLIGTAKKPSSNGSSTSTSIAPAPVEEDSTKKRKSKWDQVGLGLAPSGVRPPPSILTLTSTGTKSTVISAFGSLPKKPKI